MHADANQDLRALARRQSQRALASRELQPTATEQHELEDAGVCFHVRTIVGVDRKKHARRDSAREGIAPRGIDPFLPPYVDDLYVADVSPTHVVLLNKFPVLEDHLLVVTRADEPQQSWLTPGDFQALRLCMGEVDGLGFYNGGTAAGASQPHKHLQLVPMPVTTWPLLESEVPGFSCAVRHIDPAIDGEALCGAYREVMAQLAIDADCDPYNVLVTRDRLVVVPRTRHGFEGIRVNAMGFAGSFLVRTHDDLERLRGIGPRTVLAEVGRPA
jgi:ATP adenylyltransferase